MRFGQSSYPPCFPSPPAPTAAACLREKRQKGFQFKYGPVSPRQNLCISESTFFEYGARSMTSTLGAEVSFFSQALMGCNPGVRLTFFPTRPLGRRDRPSVWSADTGHRRGVGWGMWSLRNV